MTDFRSVCPLMGLLSSLLIELRDLTGRPHTASQIAQVEEARANAY